MARTSKESIGATAPMSHTVAENLFSIITNTFLNWIRTDLRSRCSRIFQISVLRILAKLEKKPIWEFIPVGWELDQILRLELFRRTVENSITQKFRRVFRRWVTKWAIWFGKLLKNLSVKNFNSKYDPYYIICPYIYVTHSRKPGENSAFPTKRLRGQKCLFW